ncbi:MAG: lysine decarboxylase [Francisella sp.]|jgi:lysine decarboxylase
MKSVVFVYKRTLKSYKEKFLLRIKKSLEESKYHTFVVGDMDEVVEILEENARICAIILDSNSFNIDAFHDIAHVNTK